MFWQIRKDFLSFFTRGNQKENYLDPIDGFRAIASLCITSLHLVAIFSTIINPYPDREWENYLESRIFSLLNLMGFSLEIFLMLSSFLLTYQLINEWNEKRYPNYKEFLLKDYPLLILKRILRFWPGLFLLTFILLLLGEQSYPQSNSLFELFRYLNVWLFFQNYIDYEYWFLTYTPLWSISLDMQCYFIFPLFIYLFYSIRKFISMKFSWIILFICSIVRGLILFNPLTIPLLSVGHRYSSLILLSPSHLIHWLETNYQLTLPLPSSSIPSMKLFMEQFYLPFQGRYGSFVIGTILALELIQSTSTKVISIQRKTWRKYLYLFLICFHLLTMIQSSSIPPIPSEFILRLFISSSRQIFTIGQAFLLFTVLCPSTHPYHCHYFKRFLSLPIWIPISKLSYFVYLIHFRLSLEFILGGPLKFLKNYSLTYATLISLPLIIFVCQLISLIWIICLEKPIERFVKNYFFQKSSREKKKLSF